MQQLYQRSIAIPLPPSSTPEQPPVVQLVDEDAARKAKAEEVRGELSGYYGTDGYHRHLGNVVLTDGALALAKVAGAFWLMDIIASIQTIPKVRREGFLSVILRVKKVGGHYEADFIATNGNDERDPRNVLYTQHIEYTDFPLDEIRLYVGDQATDETGKRILKVVMLTSEY